MKVTPGKPVGYTETNGSIFLPGIRGITVAFEWGLLFFIFGLFILFSAAILSVVYTLMTWTTNRTLQLLIPIVVLAAGFYFLRKADPATFVFLSLVGVIPMTILIAAFFIPGLADPSNRFYRILTCEVICTLFGGIFSIFFAEFTRLWIPWQTPLTNVIDFLGLIALNFVLAVGVFLVMKKLEIFPSRIDEKKM